MQRRAIPDMKTLNSRVHHCASKFCRFLAGDLDTFVRARPHPFAWCAGKDDVAAKRQRAFPPNTSHTGMHGVCISDHSEKVTWSGGSAEKPSKNVIGHGRLSHQTDSGSNGCISIYIYILLYYIVYILVYIYIYVSIGQN